MHTTVSAPADLPPLVAGAATGRFLTFDTSTERMSIAVCDGTLLWQHEGPGAAQSSTTLIPAVMRLMADAGLQLAQLDAIAFGRGPGSFTGLRTACAVAQGLALGAGVPVLPIDTLAALAEEARLAWQVANTGAALPAQLTALLDARMDEMYVQHFSLADGTYRPLGPSTLVRPEALPLAPTSGGLLLAGNVFNVYAGRLPALPEGSAALTLLPSAAAMLRLAPAMLAAGLARPADQALPLYVRDKVAQTTDERAQAKLVAQHAAAA